MFILGFLCGAILLALAGVVVSWYLMRKPF